MSESSKGSHAPWNPSKPGEEQKTRTPSRSISSAGKYAAELEARRSTRDPQSQAPPSHASVKQATRTDQEPHGPTKSVSSAGQYYAKEFASKQKRAQDTWTQTSPSNGPGPVNQVTSQQQRSEWSVREAELSSGAKPSISSPHMPSTYPNPASNTRRTAAQPQTPSDTGFKVSAVSSGECTAWSVHVQDLVANTKPLNLRPQDEQKLGPSQEIQALSSVISQSAPHTTVKACKTEMSLAEWINPDNAMPHSFSDDEACLRARARIIKVAQALAKTVLKMHGGNALMWGPLSPQNITLETTVQQGKSTTYEVKFEDLSSTFTEDAFKAPWLRRIPREAWSQTVDRHVPLRSNSDERDFQLGIKEADIWSLGAIFWTMCEGGVSFMNEPYNIVNFMREADKRVKSCGKWKFFALILACLQDVDGDERGVPRPGLRVHSLQKICELLDGNADEEFKYASDIDVNWGLVKDCILEDGDTGLHQLVLFC